MTHKTFFKRSIHLLIAVLMLVMSAPSAMMAADDWSYPTSAPSNPFGGGNGTQGNPYIISTAQHLANLAYMVSNKDKDYDGKYFRQTMDIVLNDNVIDDIVKEADGSISYEKNKAHFDSLKKWQPIGAYGNTWDSDFEGIYDGGGHSISGIYFRHLLESDKRETYIGLFGCSDGAQISNITIKDSFYWLRTYEYMSLGALIGDATNTVVTNCHVENSMISGDGTSLASDWNIGGLVGRAKNVFTIRNSSFDGIMDINVLKTYESTVSNCHIGGILGVKGINDYISRAFSIEDCRTSGKLLYRQGIEAERYAEFYIGGLVGLARKLSGTRQIVHCINKMDISICPDATFVPGSAFHTAGLSYSEANCYECANFGNISIGGSNFVTKRDEGKIYLAGFTCVGNAEDCFNYGNITVAPMAKADHVTISLSISEEGTANNCFLVNNNIAYNFNQGTPTVILNTGNNKVKINDLKYYTTVNGEVLYNVKEERFKLQDYAHYLNDLSGTSKYGLIKEDGAWYNGYLSLTSLGAIANSLQGKGTQDEPYIIRNASDLQTLQYMFTTGSSFKGNIFKLTANIDMTNEPEMEDIGSSTSPFDGIFDGGGHYIRGLKSNCGELFYMVTGTVKNLALYDAKSLSSHQFFGLARYVGKSSTECGSIENCFVSSDASVKVYNDAAMGDTQIGGICYFLRSGSSISNCYYTGTTTLTNAQGSGSSTLIASVGGIATNAQPGSTISNCYAVIGYNAEEGCKSNLGGIVAEDGTSTLQNNFYHIDIAASSQQPTTTKEYDGTTSADKYGIDASALGSAWIDGKYYPVLKSAHHYVCKDSEGKDVALDGTGYEPMDNEILTIVPTDDQLQDTKIWQLPNVAVYSADLGADVITNFNIIPDGCPLLYRASTDGASLKGLATYPWEVTTGVNWRSFCLPGTVSLSDLPDGCKMYVGGTYDSENNHMNIVEVESVPAGVPFLLRYNSNSNSTVYIAMSGDLTAQPQQADAASSLMGTFAEVSGSYIHSNVSESAMSGETTTYMTNSGKADCFRGYVVGKDSEQIALTDYLLLDEQSNKTDEIVEANNGQSVNVKLRRDIKTGGWNTVCLPFNVSGEEIANVLGSATRIEELTAIDCDAATNAIVMRFSAATSIEAGKSYLVYPEKAGSIFDFSARGIIATTSDKTFSVTLGDGTITNISMIGSYGKAYLLSNDEANHYFIQQDKLYRVTGKAVISLGYRCWFKVTDASGTKAQTLSSARVVHADGTITDIRLVDTGLTDGNARIYDVQGIQHGEMQKGINIVGGKKIMK